MGKNKKNNTSTEEVQDKRYRHFMLLLYPDWDSFNNILQDLKGSFKNYAYIKHIPETEEKKEHVHFILSLENPRTIESLSNRLGVDKRFIENIKSLRGACRYLVHADDEDKYQYTLDQVTTSKSFKGAYFRSFDDLMSDEEILANIYGYIDEHCEEYDPMILEVYLTQFVCENAFDRVFKRYYNTISKYISFRTN